MNKFFLKKKIIVITSTLFLLITGCNNVMQNHPKLSGDATPIPSGMGRISINLSGTDERTLLPQAPEFSRYAINFQYQGIGVSEINETVDVLPYSKDLLPGNWKILVTGYTYMEGVEGLLNGHYPAASGEVTIDVIPGAPTPVTVDLYNSNNSTKGVFQYDIGLPVEGPGSAILRILRTNKTEVTSKDLIASASGSIALDAGYYFVQVTVQTGRIRSKTDLIHIKSGYTTVAEGILWDFNTEEGVCLSLSELSEYLTSAPVNTAGNPYPVKLITDWAALSTPDEFLGELFSILNGRYVSIDLSDVTSVDGITDTLLFSAERDRLVSLVLPDGLTQINDKTFYDCTSLTSLTLPSSISSIGSFAFARTNDLSFNLKGNGILSTDETGKMLIIGNTLMAWPSASGLAVIPEGIISIGENAFMGSTKITGLRIPSSMVTIPARAFVGCINLVCFDTSASIIFSTKNDGNIINTADGELIAWPSAKDIITVPAGITAIGEEAFYMNTAIVEVYFADSAVIEKIGMSAFFGCSELSVVDFAECNIPPVLSLSSDSLINHFDGTHHNLWIFVNTEDVLKYRASWSKYAGNITVKKGSSNFVAANSNDWMSVFLSIQNTPSDTFDILVIDSFSVEPIIACVNNFMNISITLRSIDNNEIILNSNGNLIEICNGVTLILEDITLRGKTDNNASLIKVNPNGKLILGNGGKISGNTFITSLDETGGAGVYLDRGALEIAGGQISGNKVTGTGNNLRGGGVYAVNNSLVSMTGGSIMDNSVTNTHKGKGGVQGGGISIFNNSRFDMAGGVIELNTATSQPTLIMNSAASGGGVHVQQNNSCFYFEGGKIRRNTCNVLSYNSNKVYGASYGGGVFIGNDGYLIMEGGVINGNSITHSTSTNLTTTNNTAHGAFGGGVGSLDGNIVKNGGIIYGNVSGNDVDGIPLKNTAQSDIYGGCGNAVFCDSSIGTAEKLRRNDTANELQNISNAINGLAGGWIISFQTQVTIRLSCDTASWIRHPSLRINVNGVDLTPNLDFAEKTTLTYTLNVNKDDVVKIYGVGAYTSSTGYDRTFGFVAYYTAAPPNPAFTPAPSGWTSGFVGWTPANDINGKVLAYKQYGQLTDLSFYNGIEMGSFIVSSNQKGINDGEVTIAMYDSPNYSSNDWDYHALRVNINGVNLSQNITLTGGNGSSGYYYFPVYSGDSVSIYWVNTKSSNYSTGCGFAIYYSTDPPTPVFNPNSNNWSPANDPGGKILIHKQYSTTLDNGILLGSFTVP